MIFLFWLPSFVLSFTFFSKVYLGIDAIEEYCKSLKRGLSSWLICHHSASLHRIHWLSCISLSSLDLLLCLAVLSQKRITISACLDELKLWWWNAVVNEMREQWLRREGGWWKEESRIIALESCDPMFTKHWGGNGMPQFVYQLTCSICELLIKLTLDHFLGIVTNTCWWDTILCRQQWQGLMCFTFECYWESLRWKHCLKHKMCKEAVVENTSFVLNCLDSGGA